ncbi:MAG: HAD-IA family hydrolase, partial [Caulobacteraceae bacterium]|nr:HAD-IA family hydrolase [Caulobacter sp.]
DMDGTLIDSIEAAERIWARWAERQGLDVATFLPTIHGSRAIDTIGRLRLPGVDPAAEAKRIEREEIEDLEGVRPIAGALAFLDRLPAERWTIVTSAPRELAVARLSKAGIAVPPRMVTGEDITAGKPAPDCFLLGARRLGISIGDCVVFEDAPVGIQAAEAAGAGLIVVGAAHRHRAARPLAAIDGYDELSVETDQGSVLLPRRADA